MRLEVVDRELQHHFQLLQLKFVAAEVWRKERTFIIVAQQMLVIGGAAGHRRGQQMLRQNDAGAKAGPVRAVIAFADAVETVAGSHNPSIRRRTLQVFAEILEDGWVLRRKRSKIVDRLVDSRGETGGRDIMSEDSAIHDLGKKGGLRDQLSHQVRNIPLPLRHKRLLIPRASAKRNDDNFPLLSRNPAQSDTVMQQRTTQRHRRARAQELAPTPSQLPAKILRRQRLVSSEPCLVSS